MRFFKKTVFWFIALALIGGSFYLIDKQVEEKKVVEETKKRLFSFEPEDIIEFQIVAKDSDILLKKEKDNWFLERPLITAGDKETIQKLLDAVVNVKYDATLFEKQSPEKLKEMGIDSPNSLMVIFKTSAGMGKTIVFGNRNPTMNLGFAILTDDSRIFRLTANTRAEAEKSVYELRDKTTLSFEPLKIKRLEIKWADGNMLTIDHPAEGKWHIVKPREGIASAIKITELLYKLKNLNVKAFVDESPGELTGYGLHKPNLRFSIIDEKGRQRELLIGGRDRKNRGMFAKTGDGLNIFSIEEDFIVGIPKGAEELEETGVEQTTKK